MILKALKRLFESPEQTLAPFEEKFGDYERRLKEAREEARAALVRTEKASEILRELVQRKD